MLVKVINLETDIVRRQAIEENLKGFNGGKWSFFPALRGDAPSEHIPDTAGQLIRYGRELGFGEIGCFKSHVAIMKDFVENSDEDWLLVLEDDIWLDVNFNFSYVIELAKKNNINYIRLYAKIFASANILHYFGERCLIRYRTDPFGSQAYLINKAGARQFLKSLTTITKPIDDEMGRFWVNGLEPYAVYPFPVAERSVSSNLSGERAVFKDSRPLSRVLFKCSEKSAKILANLKFTLSRTKING